jgi:tetratricopeptide (TPR) repeat protein
MKKLCAFFALALLASNAFGCIWDADSLWREKARSHDLAETILQSEPEAIDANALQTRINSLVAMPEVKNPEWWNNLAGAYLRLRQPQEAVKLLEPAIKKFPDDYGMHANLGTAYHLLGRYADAEKEIARDLEINPEAHFGLEKYHLALLQYLERGADYQARHVFVDEFSVNFLATLDALFHYDSNEEGMFKSNHTNLTQAEAELKEFQPDKSDPASLIQYSALLSSVSALDKQPSYRSEWNLASDSKLEEGVVYMAQMNPKEPACFTMLGIVAWKTRDYHLAKSAFEKAIMFGSPQSDLLKYKISQIDDYIQKSPGINVPQIGGVAVIGALAAFFVGYYVFAKVRDSRKVQADLAV